MHYDAEGPDEARVAAVLLHPHPHFGGDRHHPFVAGMYRALPRVGSGAVRFDFVTADPEAAADQVASAIDVASVRWPQASVVLAGYSFGAGVALRVTDERVRGWFLVAPPAQMFAGVAIAGDPRPKRIVVPERDQFSAIDLVEELTAEWPSTSISTVDDDHYLWNVVDEVVRAGVSWLTSPT